MRLLALSIEVPDWLSYAVGVIAECGAA